MVYPQIGICSWAIDRSDVCRAIRLARSELGVAIAQIGFFGVSTLRGVDRAAINAIAASSGVTIDSVFLGFDGQDYSSFERLAETGGYVLDDHYDARKQLTKEAGVLARELGSKAVVVHAGAVPADRYSPQYAKLRLRVGEIADSLDAEGIRLLLETGQEPASQLAAFVDGLGAANVAINFDAGNYVIHGTDDPLKAASQFKARIESVHVKDAVGKGGHNAFTGKAVPLGLGEVPIPRIMSRLRVFGYEGPIFLETGSREVNLDALRHSVAYLRSLQS